MARVLVAMSGGVDSAVAAALLLDAGHEVTGVHLRLTDVPVTEQVPGHGCCTLDDAQDARRAAQVLGVPFYVWDLSEEFAAAVERPFAPAYARGETPNPCVTCNERVKYAALLERALSRGFDALATGHHARLRRRGRPVTVPGSGVTLHRGADTGKDQSYVLYMADARQLACTLLPVGELTKQQVRALAGERGLRVADKPDSYDVCFVSDGDTAGYLAARLPPSPGPVVDIEGREVGRHDGTWRFTVGQRRGLGDLRTGGRGRPSRSYVVDVDPASSTVRVGPRDALECCWVEIDAPRWVHGSRPRGPVRTQVRSHGRSVGARVGPVDDDGRPASAVRITLDEPLHGVALGQAAVVYDVADTQCLGGGPIVRAQRHTGLPVTRMLAGGPGLR